MNNQTPSSDQFISFQEFFTVLKDNYQKAFLISAFFVMMSTIYSFSLTEQFTSEVTFKVSTKGNEPSQTQGSGLSISSLLSGKGSTTNLGYEIVSIIKSNQFIHTYYIIETTIMINNILILITIHTKIDTNI